MEFTILHNSGGNHGHQLKDHFGGITIGKLLGLEYRHSAYSYLDYFLPGLKEVELSRIERVLRRKHRIIGPVWGGIPDFEGFMDYFKQHFERSHQGSLIVLEKAMRILPHQTIKWFEAKQIDRDIFSEVVRENSRRFRANNENSFSLQRSEVVNVAMHIGRGADFDECLYPEHFRSSKEPRFMFNIDYFMNIYEQLNSLFGRKGMQVDVYSEQINSEDIIAAFGDIENVNIRIGENRDRITSADVHDIFTSFVTSDVLVTCNSSFSVMAVYYREGRPTIYHPHYHLMDLPESPYLATDEYGHFQVDILGRIVLNVI